MHENRYEIDEKTLHETVARVKYAGLGNVLGTRRCQSGWVIWLCTILVLPSTGCFNQDF